MKDSHLKISALIRPMTPNDVDTIISLEEEIFPDPWPEEAFVEGLIDDQHHFLVAETDDRVVGYASYSIGESEGHLTNIAVSPEFRRKSIAKKLLEHILNAVKKAGCVGIFLDVRPSNQSAIDFYRVFDFNEAYIRPRYYRNPEEDALVMVKYLHQQAE
jgi:ribosomal-protein-alanine N-acetyltransferase